MKIGRKQYDQSARNKSQSGINPNDRMGLINKMAASSNETDAAINYG